MIKKVLFLIMSLLPVMGMKAQSSVGSWEVYANYLSPEKMLQTPSKVFILSSGSVYSFDKNTEELYHYGLHNILSEATAANIFYNAEKDYIAVTYESGNIDIIKNDGKAVNLPDIRDAVIQQERTINDVSFGNDRIYVATAFGIVVFDDKRWEVKESGIYNKNVKFVAATENFVGAYFSSERRYGVIPVDKTIRYFDNFVLSSSTTGSLGMRGLGNNLFLVSVNEKSFSPALLDYNVQKGTISIRNQVSDANYTGPYECKGGYYIYNTVKSGSNIACIKQFDKDYNITVTNLPTDFSGKLVSMWDDPNEVYLADVEGISECSYDDAGNITVLRNSFKPEAVTSNGVGNLYASDSGKIYVSSHSWDIRYKEFPGARTVNISYIDIIENNTIKDITPTGLTYSGYRDVYKGGKADGTGRPAHTYKIVEDPEDADVYYITTLYDGVYKIKDNKQAAYYNDSNSPLSQNADIFYDSGLDFDSKGNMWVAGNAELYVLPADKRKLNGTAVADDWTTVDYSFRPNGDIQRWYTELIACKKSNAVILSIANNSAIYGLDTNGTVTTSDDKSYCWEKFIDQDGKEFDMTSVYVYCFEEDHNGNVWVGTDAGPFIINDPKNIANPSMRVQRIKVPRNDGTNYADYLLDGETVTSIAVDGVNRKWIATANSGVYLVNENGTQILEHFTTENSYLPSNRILVVECDKFSNAVYFGSISGLVKYNSDAAPAREDYSEVYAYPNPVRPEYNGWITIAGLMEDSLVKIADASGNVFYQGTSQGGILTWDGCDASGERVKTGVYYVFASQNGNGSSSGAVTKILVVK